MARAELIVELATNHGGDIELAKRMIQAAAEAGADIVKTQGFQVKHLRKTDPQYAWMAQCELSEDGHRALVQTAKDCGVRYLSTAYHVEDLWRLKDLGLEAVKIGSGEGRDLAMLATAGRWFKRVYVTLAWGEPKPHPLSGIRQFADHMTVLGTAPLYPAPTETYCRVSQRDGYSDHHVGLTVAKLAIAQGARVIEKHFHIADCPQHRQQAWNMTPESLRELRTWAEECAQAVDGTRYEGRWTA